MYHDIFDIDTSEICRDIYKNKEESGGNTYSNINGWQSIMFGKIGNAGYTHDSMTPLLLKIKESMIPIYRDFGLSIEPTISYWFNVNKKGCYNVKHKHPDSFMAGCFYLKVPEDSGTITFYREDLVGNFEFETKRNKREFEVMPSEKLFITWTSMLPHSVGVNHSDDDRISIAFNFN